MPRNIEQAAYTDVLQKDDRIREIRCNFSFFYRMLISSGLGGQNSGSAVRVQ